MILLNVSVLLSDCLPMTVFATESSVAWKIVLLCSMTLPNLVNGPPSGLCAFNLRHATWFVSPKKKNKKKKKKQCNILYDYTLEGSKLIFLDRFKYLGVNITCDLNWNYHVYSLCNKACKTLGLLKGKLQMCLQSVKLQTYKGLIRPGHGKLLTWTGVNDQHT